MGALSPEAFVIALYRGLLDREPDPAGLAAWVRLIQQEGDPTLAMAGIMESEEFRSRSSAKRAIPQYTSLAREAQRDLGRSLRVVDVGAQWLGPGSNPYDPLSGHTRIEVIGFDPLEHRLAERAAVERHEWLTLLPYAIGDGECHTLYVNNDDATSSLFPLNDAHNARFNHLCGLHTVSTRTLRTRRLDDVLPPGPVDFLKLDVQGAELMVLQSAQRTLEQTAVVHCEVEFGPIYLGQPLYPDIQAFLNQRQFELIDLVMPQRYHYVGSGVEAAEDRLLWADAVFFRITEDAETRRAQSLIAAAIYRKPSLAAQLLRAAGPAN